MILLKLCFQPFVETSLCLFGLIHLSVHWIQRQLLHSTIQGHLTTKLAEPCQWFYKFKIIEKSVQVMCCCKILPTYTSNVWFFQSPDSILCSLPVAWGWGVRGKGRAQLYGCTSFGGFGFFWGILGSFERQMQWKKKTSAPFSSYENFGFGCMTLWSTQPSFGPPFQNMSETFEDNILFWSAKLGVYPVCQVNSSFIVLPHPSNPMVGKPKKN